MSNIKWSCIIPSIAYITEIPQTLIPDFTTLFNAHPEERPDVLIPYTDKVVKAKRWQQVYGHPYNFGRLSHAPLDMSCIPSMSELVAYAFPNVPANEIGAVVNWYDTGEDTIGYHGDNLIGLVPGSDIFVYTFISPGEPARDFLLKHLETGLVTKVKPWNGTLLAMRGNCQTEYHHCIPVRKGKYGRRVSVTLRHFSIKK